MNLRRLAGQIAGVGRWRAQCPDGLVVVNNTLCAEDLAECWRMPPAQILEAVRFGLMHDDGSLRFGVWTQDDETFIQVRPRRGPQRAKGKDKGGDKGSLRGGKKGVGKDRGFVKGGDKGLGKGGGVGKGPLDQADGDEDEADANAFQGIFNDYLEFRAGNEDEASADLRMFKDFLEFRAERCRYAPY